MVAAAAAAAAAVTYVDVEIDVVPHSKTAHVLHAAVNRK